MKRLNSINLSSVNGGMLYVQRTCKNRNAPAGRIIFKDGLTAPQIFPFRNKDEFNFQLAIAQDLEKRKYGFVGEDMNNAWCSGKF